MSESLDERAYLLRDHQVAEFVGTGRAWYVVGASSGERCNAHPSDIEDYDGAGEYLFHNFIFE